jgi:(methylthio)acryloyl-CoA hydratase
VVLDASGENFSAGLDLAELSECSTFEGVAHSMMWHRLFEQVELGRVPVVAVLKGAVVGGGLELALAAHIRVAERTAYYALPEGQRGIFGGGGGAVRLPRLIGAARMVDMMLTGRVYGAEEGQALGISHYLVDNGQGLAKGLDLAGKIARNAPITNFAVIHALPRIAEANPREGFMMEALMAAVAQGSEEAKDRLRAFLSKSAPRR